MGWGIKMYRTVFSAGEEIPVIIISYQTKTLVDPADPVFPDYGSFQVTRNDGSIVIDHRPVIGNAPELPLIEVQGHRHHLDLTLNRYADLSPGEYNLRFRYLDQVTPTIPIEIYNRLVKIAF
jgi:hypothetical protein